MKFVSQFSLALGPYEQNSSHLEESRTVSYSPNGRAYLYPIEQFMLINSIFWLSWSCDIDFNFELQLHNLCHLSCTSLPYLPHSFPPFSPSLAVLPLTHLFPLSPPFLPSFPSVFTGFETANKYRIRNTLGQQVYFAAERKLYSIIILLHIRTNTSCTLKWYIVLGQLYDHVL